MKLVVLTYPYHYHITQLAINQAKKHFPNIDLTYIIWDDTHKFKPSMPLYECMKDCVQISWSRLNLKAVGWAGQQIIKLHLDTVINEKEFIILDGDLIINQDLDPKNVLYSGVLPRQHGAYDHLSEVLGLGVYSFNTCPFMFVEARWLKEIRELCLLHSHMTLEEKLTQSANQNGFLDWNIIAQYQLRCLKSTKKIEYFHRSPMSAKQLEMSFNDTQNFVLNGPDNFSIEFLESKNITVDRNLMRQLNYIHD